MAGTIPEEHEYPWNRVRSEITIPSLSIDKICPKLSKIDDSGILIRGYCVRGQCLAYHEVELGVFRCAAMNDVRID